MRMTKSNSDIRSNERKPNEPFTYESQYQEKKVIVRQRDLKKWTPEEQRDGSLIETRTNQNNYAEKIGKIIKNPNEVIKGNDIHYQQRDCLVYVKTDSTSTGKQQKTAVIVDSKSGRTYLSSPITNEEYLYLKETGNIDLFDMNRDPQTMTFNKKSEIEATAIKNAKDQGLFSKVKNIRRPYNI